MRKVLVWYLTKEEGVNPRQFDYEGWFHGFSNCDGVGARGLIENQSGFINEIALNLFKFIDDPEIAK